SRTPAPFVQSACQPGLAHEAASDRNRQLGKSPGRQRRQVKTRPTRKRRKRRSLERDDATTRRAKPGISAALPQTPREICREPPRLAPFLRVRARPLLVDRAAIQAGADNAPWSERECGIAGTRRASRKRRPSPAE